MSIHTLDINDFSGDQGQVNQSSWQESDRLKPGNERTNPPIHRGSRSAHCDVGQPIGDEPLYDHNGKELGTANRQTEGNG